MFLKTTDGALVPVHRIRRISAPSKKPPAVGICDVELDDGEEEIAYAEDVTGLTATVIAASPGWRVAELPMLRSMPNEALDTFADLDDTDLLEIWMTPAPVVAWNIVDGRGMPVTPLGIIGAAFVLFPPAGVGAFAIQPDASRYENRYFQDAGELAATLRTLAALAKRG